MTSPSFFFLTTRDSFHWDFHLFFFCEGKFPFTICSSPVAPSIPAHQSPPPRLLHSSIPCSPLLPTQSRLFIFNAIERRLSFCKRQEQKRNKNTRTIEI
ncbi:Hypothetical protein, putative [Bodo saltans]|uniref:Uncharacterized protein n=1 Tax=Bodo saltans TaxID=75058 RepID=A0A0S4J5E0_BODSA|nr:Hypothetical protein, putative [Bodo saltans]|eukprot:CUG86648.1 Hypothetical protein, putative [Bodo saltans]